jgi:methylmalonyl-CoA mutase
MFQNFDKQTAESWKEKIITDLKGGDYDELLRWSSLEGIDVEPFYSKENLTSVSEAVYQHTDWEICEDIIVEDEKKGQSDILSALQKGVNTINLHFKGDASTIDFSLLFKDVLLNAIGIIVSIESNQISVLKDLLSYIKSEISISEVSIRASYDLLTPFYQKGNMIDQSFITEITDLQKEFSYSNIKLLAVDTRYLQLAGSRIDLQNAISLAIVQYWIDQVGDSALQHMAFYKANGANYFFEIAKLRSFRKIFAFMAKEYNQDVEPFVYVENSLKNKTVYDPYVNMLRSGSESLSAALGGANAIKTVAFDEVYTQPNEFSKRIARNQQILLKGESYIGKVADPSQGAYYIEVLTEALLNKSYSLFQNIEEQGFENFVSDSLKTMVLEMNETYKKAYSELETPLLGTNLYPNKKEVMREEIKLNIDPFKDNHVPARRLSVDDELVRINEEKA